MAVVHNPDEYKAVHVERLLAMVPEWKLDAAHSKGVVTGQVGRLFVCLFVCSVPFRCVITFNLQEFSGGLRDTSGYLPGKSHAAGEVA